MPLSLRIRIFVNRLLCFGEIDVLGSWGSMVARLKLKRIDGRALPDVEYAA